MCTWWYYSNPLCWLRLKNTDAHWNKQLLIVTGCAACKCYCSAGKENIKHPLTSRTAVLRLCATSFPSSFRFSFCFAFVGWPGTLFPARWRRFLRTDLLRIRSLAFETFPSNAAADASLGAKISLWLLIKTTCLSIRSSLWFWRTLPQCKQNAGRITTLLTVVDVVVAGGCLSGRSDGKGSWLVWICCLMIDRTISFSSGVKLFLAL